MRSVEVKVGCCGWAEARERYFKNFDLLEIQETFYQPGSIPRYEKWAREAPGDFEFAVKAWQIITHPPSSPTYRRLKEKIPEGRRKSCGFFRPSHEVLDAWRVVEKIARSMGSKLILFQCPASFKPDEESMKNMIEFFKKINSSDFILIWEPRGSWDSSEIKELCRKLDLVHCVDPFKQKSAWGNINYFRLHGKPGYNLEYSYTPKDMKKLERLCDRNTNYVLFNNLSMARDAKRFRKLIG